MMNKPVLICLLMAMTSNLAAQGVLLECAHLVDTEEGRILENQAILVNADKVIAVGGMDELARQLVDTEPTVRHRLDTCLPGLMDMHVHLRHQNSPGHFFKRFVRNEADNALRAAYFARITLESGFTTVRDMGDGGYETLALRDAITEGIAVGPRIYASGKSVATTGGHADPTAGFRRDLMGDPGPAEGVIEGPVEAREAIRYRYKVGVDAIKITATGGVLSMASNGQNPQFTMQELESLVTAATEYGLHVAAHAHGREGIRRAVTAGVRSIEHGTFLDEQLMQEMKDRDTFLVPTLLAGKFVGDKSKEAGYFPDMVRTKAATIGPVMNQTFAHAYDQGVRIAFGTDSGVSAHGENAVEFMLMVENGMPAMEAIQSATTTAAELLQVTDKLGRIAPGYYADIIAVNGDPVADPALLQDVRFVMKGGVVYKSD